MLNDQIFREYDIRGVYGRDLNRDTAIALGKAFSAYIKKLNPHVKCLSVGRDVRISSTALSSGVIGGIVSAGINVYDIGICPTPLQYFSIHHLNIDGGIMVTGSHNPPEYNGFKLSAGRGTIHGEAIQKLKEIMSKQEWDDSNKRGAVKNYNIIEAYKDYMLSEFSYLNKPGVRRIKIVVDAGNGTAGLIAPEILSRIGCDVTPLYCEPDGSFPNHHPDPTVVEYIKDLINVTKETGADIGIGYDGDADRIGVVDRNGDIIWGDHLMIVLARELLRHNPGARIIGDVKCSQDMFDEVKRHGGIPIMWKTGHSLIKQKMREENALLAGEFSGHIFIADRYFGYDDAIYTTLRLIEIMKNTGKDIKELLSDVPKMYFTPEIRIDCPDEKKKDALEKIILRFADYKKNGGIPYRIVDMSVIDGVRVVFERGWGLIRASNTQPVIVMRAEAQDEKSMNNYRAFLTREFDEALKV